MVEDNKKYVVHGMYAECSMGTMKNYLNTDVGHGIVYQGQPLLNANDHTPQINLTHFGDCNSKMFFEQAKKEANEKYKVDENDNFFEKVGKAIAKNATKAAATVQGCLGMNKCQLDTPLPWIFCNDEHMIDGAPALTMNSVCTCKFGGVIKIVEQTEESNVEIDGQSEEETVYVSMTPAYAGEEIQVNLLQNTQQKISAEVEIDLDKLLEENKKIPRQTKEKIKKLNNQIKKNKEMEYINKYVNEETLIQINPARWGEIGKDENGNEVYVAIEALKKNYGDDVFEQIGTCMYKYGITDETSILMFLSTIGTETYYGTAVVQGKKGNPAQGLKADELPSINSSLGIGLLQVTSLANQQEFIRYKYDSLEDGTDEKNLIKKYFNNIDIKGEDSDKDKTAGFICKYYPIEASIWYWAVHEREGITVNKFVEKHKDGNLSNVFLATQAMTNGTEIRMRSYERIASLDNEFKISTECITGQGHQTEYCLYYKDEQVEIHSYAPYHWEDRKADWERAEVLLNEE